MRLRAAVLTLLVATAFALVLPAARPPASLAAGSVAFSDARHGWRLTLEGFRNYARPGKAVLWRTSNGGATWKQVKSAKPGVAADGTLTPGLLALDGAAGLWARTFWNGADLPWLRTADGAAAWKTAPDPIRDTLADVAFASAKVVWACDYAGGSLSGGSIYKSTNGGLTWKRSLHIAPRAAAGSENAFVAIAAPAKGTAYVAAKGSRLGGLWSTTNGGRYWHHGKAPGGGAVAVAFPSVSTGWVVSPAGSISRTTDGGHTWTTQLAETGRHLSSIVFTDLQHGWAAGEDGALVRTTDGGATWQWLDPGTEDWLWGLDFADPAHGWVTHKDYSKPSAPNDLLLRTIDGGSTWAPLF